MRQMQDTKQDKRDPTLPTNLLSSFGWAYRYGIIDERMRLHLHCLSQVFQKRGWCRFGDRCKYRHEATEQRRRGGKPAAKDEYPLNLFGAEAFFG